MEQLRQLGGRLLGKKSVVVSLLGLLGLCCPSSLWAEKLDTTFVLNMVIDTTPCYYTKYDNKGNVERSGRYAFSDYFRVNVGYVTNEKGERIDTLTYVCNVVTKQWNARSMYEDSDQVYFYANGMLKTIKREAPTYISVVDYKDYVNFSSDGLPEEEVYSLHSHDGGANFSIQSSETQYDTHGNILKRTSSSSSYHQGGSAWSNGSNSSESNYKNKYDAKDNLIEEELTYRTTTAGSDQDASSATEKTEITRSKMVHSYDSQNRRIKTITYTYINSDYVLEDSVIYTYGYALGEGVACLLAINVNGKALDGFSSDKYQYDFSNDPSYYILDYKKDVRYVVPIGSSVEELSYDSETHQLTITVLGSGSSSDSSNKKTYTIRLSAPGSYITSMTSKSTPVKDFSYDKYEYNFMDSTYAWAWSLNYEFSPGSTVKKSYDDSTNTLLIRVYGADFKQDSSNMHTYSIRCKAPEAYLTSLSFNGTPVDNFSPTVIKYTLPDLYSPLERSISYTASPGSVVTETVSGTTLYITITDELHTQKNEYVINYSTMEACLTSLSIKGKPVSDFSWDKYEYDFSDSLEYHEGDVSYTLQQHGIRVNRTYMESEDWGIFAHTRYSDRTGVLEISINYDYIGPGSKGTADMKTYVIKFKKPKIESSLTSLELDGVPVDSFSTDKYVYDFSKYYYSSSDISDKYSGVIILKKMSNDSFDTYRSQNELRWDCSKYATTDVSYDEETGTVSVIVKGENYAEDSSSIHVYKILTRKIDSMVIDSFHVSYTNRPKYKNDVKVIANKHQYEAFSNLLVAFDNDGRPNSSVSYSVFANIPDVDMSIQYSEASHTIIYAFSHKLIQSLVDTYYVALKPCVILISETYEAIDKLEHNLIGEYKPEDFEYKLPKGVVATKSYDDSTRILTLTARFEEGDTTLKTEYLIHFRPVDGVDDFLGDQVKLYVTDKTICVDGATEPISVYDLRGTLVGISRGEEIRIPVAQAGVYVVRSGGKAVKVVVR